MKSCVVGFLAAFLPFLASAETNIHINGRSFSISGNNVVIVNGELISRESVKGSGIPKEETRETNEFASIALNISADVKVTYGETPSLNVTADDNILPIITTQVTGGRLIISSEEIYSTQNSIEVEIQAPMIQEVTIRGSGNVFMDSVTRDELSLLVSGSGNIDAIGSVDNVEAQINGSGDLRLANLSAKNCRLTINGSGNAAVSVSEALHAIINGSGDVSYHGRPQKVISKVNGSGDIYPKG